MKFRRFSLLLAFGSAFALGLFAAAPIKRLLPPLTGAQRTAIVEEMERSVYGAWLCAEYYSYGPFDEGFYRGCQYQASVDAELLASRYTDTSSPATEWERGWIAGWKSVRGDAFVPGPAPTMPGDISDAFKAGYLAAIRAADIEDPNG